MPKKIKFLKLTLRSIDQDEMNSCRSFCATRKNKNLQKRLNKKINNKTKTIVPPEESFKKNWFCKDCQTVFHLKPESRYKTLLEYNINCPSCNSENTAHGDDLSKAIRESRPKEELIKLAEERQNINFPSNHKFVHYMHFYNTVKKKEADIPNKEYFALDITG